MLMVRRRNIDTTLQYYALLLQSIAPVLVVRRLSEESPSTSCLGVIVRLEVPLVNAVRQLYI